MHFQWLMNLDSSIYYNQLLCHVHSHKIAVPSSGKHSNRIKCIFITPPFIDGYLVQAQYITQSQHCSWQNKRANIPYSWKIYRRLIWRNSLPLGKFKFGDLHTPIFLHCYGITISEFKVGNSWKNLLIHQIKTTQKFQLEAKYFT